MFSQSPTAAQYLLDMFEHEVVRNYVANLKVLNDYQSSQNYQSNLYVI